MTETIKIAGMSCGHCSARVAKALNALPGVHAEVSHESGSATITADVLPPEADLVRAVEAAGYTVVR
jgi:Copper chaperone